jgi:hypothetical protein
MEALALGDEDAEVEGALGALLQIEKAQEGVRFGDAEGVAGEKAHATLASLACRTSRVCTDRARPVVSSVTR